MIVIRFYTGDRSSPDYVIRESLWDVAMRRLNETLDYNRACVALNIPPFRIELTEESE